MSGTPPTDTGRKKAGKNRRKYGRGGGSRNPARRKKPKHTTKAEIRRRVRAHRAASIEHMRTCNRISMRDGKKTHLERAIEHLEAVVALHAATNAVRQQLVRCRETLWDIEHAETAGEKESIAIILDDE
jgi:hypothetical protein